MDAPNAMCLLPVFNASAYLEEAISSILNQSYENFRLLIINDGSTDRSENIIDSFKDVRIEKLNNEKNLGLIYTLNKGLDYCSEKYLIRMDADDVCEKNRFQTQISFMEEHPDVWVSGSQVKYFDHENAVSDLPSSFEAIKAHLFFRNAIAHPSVIIRNDKLKEYNIRYEQAFLHAEDYRLWTKIVSYGGKIQNLEKVLLKYRVAGQNISLNNFENSFSVTKEIWKDYFKIYGFYPSDSELILHGMFSGIVPFKKDRLSDLLVYLTSFRKWLKNMKPTLPDLIKFYKSRLDKFFFIICDCDPRLVISYWKFRKIVKPVEFRYWSQKVRISAK